MKIATASEMREIDRAAVQDFGMHGLALMERAGAAVAARIKADGKQNKVLVLCGPGNNGGDGLVVARELHNAGFSVRALMAGERRKLGSDCKAQLDAARKFGVPVAFGHELASRDLHAALVVDALFGTGLKKDITGPLAALIGKVNASGAPVVSVDIPSGISADSGQVMGAAIMASSTVTFGLPKRGHCLHPGAAHTGILHVEDIGFPKALMRNIPCALLTAEYLRPLLPLREAYSHKGDYGHVLVIAGSRGKTGAALMAARACLKSGAGLVTLGVPETLAPAFMTAAREEMVLPLPDTGRGELAEDALDPIIGFLDRQADVLALGPGLGTATETVRLVHAIAVRSTKPMAIDADGLNALALDSSLFGLMRAPSILTPHPGELSRLSGISKENIESDRIESALEFAKKSGAVVALKGAPTIVADPEGRTFVNPTGNAGMAKAGTGDVLTGMIGALLAQGLGPLEASALGVYLHGLAGDASACECTQYSCLASDIIQSIPIAIRRLSEGAS